LEGEQWGHQATTAHAAADLQLQGLTVGRQERPNIYVVEWRDRMGKPQTSLVAAHAHHFALRTVELNAPGQVVMEPKMAELHLGDFEDYDNTALFWVGGNAVT
jgi:hypothetical protein